MIWIDCAVATVASVRANDDYSIPLLPDNWGMDSQGWDDWWWAAAASAAAAH